MTVNPRDDTFDITAEGKKLIADYPALGSTAVFIYAGKETDFYAAPITIAFFGLLRRDFDKAVADTARLARRHYTSIVETGGENIYHLIAINPDDVVCAFSAPALHARTMQFTLYHEAAHALSPLARQAKGAARTPLAENIADAYAALRLIREIGIAKARPAIENIIAFRAGEFVVSGRTHYMTIKTLEHILQTPQKTHRMTPADLLSRAEELAEMFQPQDSDFNAVTPLFKQFKPAVERAQQKIDMPAPAALSLSAVRALATTILATPDRFAFQIGTLALNPLLHDGGTICGCFNARLPAKERAALTAAFKKRAADFNLGTLSQKIGYPAGAAARPSVPR